MTDKPHEIQFERTLWKNGETLVVRLPKEITEQLQLKDKDEVKIVAKQGNKGPYIAIWKP